MKKAVLLITIALTLIVVTSTVCATESTAQPVETTPAQTQQVEETTKPTKPPKIKETTPATTTAATVSVIETTVPIATSSAEPTVSPYIVTVDKAIIYTKIKGKMVQTTVYYEKDKKIDVLSIEGDYALTTDDGYVLKSDIASVVVTKDETGATQLVAPAQEPTSSSSNAASILIISFIVGLGAGFAVGWFLKGRQDLKSFANNPEIWHERVEGLETEPEESKIKVKLKKSKGIKSKPSLSDDESEYESYSPQANKPTKEQIQSEIAPSRRRTTIPDSYDVGGVHKGQEYYFDNDDTNEERRDEPFMLVNGKKQYFNEKYNN